MNEYSLIFDRSIKNDMRKRDADKEKLVKDIAIELIGKGGFENFSMNKLAKACSISVATLYIYYQDKEDLIVQLVTEQGKIIANAMLKDFDPDSSFETGLRKQWENRYNYMINNRRISLLFEQLRSSVYHDQFLNSFMEDMREPFARFSKNIVDRGEVNPMTVEVYWSVAFAPLFALIKLNNEGRNIDGSPFQMTDQILWETFNLVVKALKK